MLPSKRSQIARIGAYRLHATHNPKETTSNARQAFLAKFLDEVDPHRTLPEAERNRRAKYAKKAYFTTLAYLSATARSKVRKGRSPAKGKATKRRFPRETD